MSLGKLIIQKGQHVGAVIRLETLPFTIGRLETSSLVLIDEKVSRQHAKIEKNQNDLILFDCGSRNGVFVNGKKISRHPLLAGDILVIGSTTIVFETDTNAISDPMESTEEASEEAFIQPEIHPLLKLMRAQLPAKAIAVQIVNYLHARYQLQESYLYWKQEKEIFVRKSKRDQAPIFEAFDTFLNNDPVTQATIKEIPNKGRFLVAPLVSAGKNAGLIYVKQSIGAEAFSQKDKNDLEVVRLISETALERSELFEKSQNDSKNLQLVERFVSANVLKDIFSRESAPERSALEVEEKEVTILFCDIQGFTPLSERLAPSEISALLNEYFQRMVDVITKNHGEVNKFIGDAIMALFGAPKSHGNDALHAVTAAEEMISALKLFWKNIAESKRFNIRIGINTGKVVVGNIGSLKKLEYTVLGDAVNIASRLEALAPTNGVIIGSRTAELIQDAFELEFLPGTKVKGKSQEIDVYRVLRRRSAK